MINLLNKYNRMTIDKKMKYIYKGQQLKYDSDITLEKYFKNEYNVKIFVIDINNLLLINWYQKREMTFKKNNGYKHELLALNKESIDDLLKKYLKQIDYSELMNNNDKIQFL